MRLGRVNLLTRQMAIANQQPIDGPACDIDPLAVADPRGEVALVSRPAEEVLKADAAGLTASEQCYFLGAPLAHVCAYEDHLRHSRSERQIQRDSRISNH